MFDKINPWKIVAAHVATLRSYRGKGVNIGDLFLFFISPAILIAILAWRDLFLLTNQIGTMLTAMSIFGALLFNLLILVYDVATRDRKQEASKIRRNLIRELHSNIEFAVLLSILTIVSLLGPTLTNSDTVLKISSVIAYYFTGVFILTLLMILKRIRSLLNRELDEGQKSLI